MRPLDIDYARSPVAGGIAGWALLALSLAFAADVARSSVAASADVASLDERISRATRLAPTYRGGAERLPSSEELAAARAVVARFATPWPRLFSAIESVRNDAVTLLAIEPDTASGTVTISGEATNYRSLLAYTRRLDAAHGLASVHLARHEVRASDPQRPIAFAISAKWRRP